MTEPLRVAIVAEHASARFGGEAALPLHYFRVLSARGIPVWLISHARTRAELSALYPGDERIRYVEDSTWHRVLWRLSHLLPARIDYITTGFLMRLSTQRTARRLVRELVARHGVQVVHQPMPVSPREPSLMFGVGAPVVIGPMNGGMDYPPAFRREGGPIERSIVSAARSCAALLNRALPGKRRAACLLVANDRTRAALAGIGRAKVVEMVENGVDLALWSRIEQAAVGAAPSLPASGARAAATRFVFMGRLVDWKAVDLLLRAFAAARERAPMRLSILGDGPERRRLEALAGELRIDPAMAVEFAGWLPQAECAARLRGGDVLVLPSLLECGGAVVLEAMAAGKPVIATAWGGPLDYLDPDCGILLPPTSRDALVASFAEAMTRLAGDAALRRRLGEQGRKKVLARFDWELKVDRMLDVYRDAIREAASRPRSAAAAGGPS